MVKQQYISYSWRTVRYQRFYQVADQVVDEVQELVWADTGKAKRRLKNDGLKKLTYSIDKLIRDSVSVVLINKYKPNCAIAKSKMRYEANRDDALLTYDIFIKRAYKGMIELGYLYEAEIGFYDRNPNKSKFSKSRLTRYRAEDKLLNLFTRQEQKVLPVIVPPKQIEPLIVQQKVISNKVTSKVRLKFEETDEATKIRENLLIINKAVSSQWYDIEIDNEEISALQRKLVSKEQKEQDKEYTVDLSQRLLCRIFNDVNLETGGRFYGGWWQNIPKAYRTKLLVDGKRMVEFDYSNLHPTILYRQEGLKPPKDSYSLVIDEHFQEVQTNRASLRQMVKKAFNAMLNANKPMKNAPGRVKPKEFGLKWSQVSNAVLKSHSDIAHHFYTGAGLKLQKVDSQIAEKVLLHFAKRRLPILPLHDSFLMHHGFEKELPSAMRKAFEEMGLGEVEVDQKADERTTNTVDMEDFDPNTEELNTDILDVIDLLSQGYFQRESTFREIRSNIEQILRKQNA